MVDRVALDGSRLQDASPGGVGRYIEAIAARLASRVDLCLVVDERKPVPELDVRMLPLTGPRGAPRLVWLEVAVGRWLPTFDGLFHGPFNAVPLRARPGGGSVVTIHDLAPQRFPDDFGASAKKMAWRVSMRRSARMADVVIVPSQFTRDEVVAEFGLEPDSVAVIPNAASSWFSPSRRSDSSRVMAALGVQAPYVVTLGGARRRNVTTAVSAWRLAQQHIGAPVGLVVLGETALPPEPGMIQVGHLGDAELAALVAGAEAFLYPTRYEGFGLPALEAAACATPTVCAAVASLPEILGDAAAWCESLDVDAVAGTLAELLIDESRREELSEAALERALTAPTWDDNADATFAAYERAQPSKKRAPTDKPAEVSVVIVNWNAGRRLLDCVESFRANAPHCSYEVVVVDNASTDRSADLVAQHAPWVRLIRNRENRGLAPANNQGIEATSGKYVLISNPDVVYRAGAVDALIDLLERRPRAAFAVSRLLHPDGTPHPAAGDLPTLTDAFIGRQLGRGGTDSGYWWRQWAHDEERQIGHGGEACYLVRRVAIEDIGLQDEHYPLDWEGIEWSRRAHAHGWEIWFCHTAEVVHAGGVSIRQALARWVVLSHRGMYRYFRSEVPFVARPLLLAAVTARASAKLALLRRQGSRLYDAANLRVSTDHD